MLVVRRGQHGELGKGLVDFAGRQAMTSLFGELVTGAHVDDVSLQFQYNNSPKDVIVTTTGQGSNSNALSMGKVAVDAGGIGLSQMRSLQSLRYRPGHEAFCQMTTRMVGGEAGVTQFFGIGNGADRVGFGTDQGIFGAWFWEGGNKTFVPQEDFNVDKLSEEWGRHDTNGIPLNASGFTLDPTKLNLYMVSFGWLGIAPLMVSVYGGWERGWILAHVFDFANMIEEPHLQNPSLPILAETERLAGDGEVFIQTSSWRLGVVAGREEQNASNRRFGARRLNVSANTGTAGTGIHLLSLKSVETFQGKENHVRAAIDFIISTNEVNKTVEFLAFATAQIESVNPGFTAGLTYADVDSDSSIMQVATDSIDDLSLAGLTALDVGIVGPSTQRANPDVKGFDLYAGTEITFLIPREVGAGDVSIQMDWDEFF